MGTGVTGDDNDMIELDPDGKSIGFSDPGLGWTTDPQDLFNSETSFGSLQNGIFTSYSIDGLNIPYDTFMMEAGRLGRSLDVGCTRGRVWVNPYSVYQEYRMINDCIDNMTLARHGIFAYEVPGQERIPARWDYAFASPLSPPSDDVQANIASIFDLARKALNTSNQDPTGIDCAELFGGKGLEFLEAYAKSIGRGGALRFSDKNADGGKFTIDDYASTSGSKTVTIGKSKYSIITFNKNTPLFFSKSFEFSGASENDFGHLTFAEFWAAALLHEIGHAIRNRYGSGEEGGMIDPDGSDSARSRANQKFVVDTCFPKP